MHGKSGSFPGSLHLGNLALITVLVLTFCDADTGWTADQGVPVAHVNGVTLYQSDLSCAIEVSLAKKLSSNANVKYPDPQRKKVDSRKTLDRLINIELLYQESLKHRFRGLAEESEKRYQVEVKRLGGENRLASALECNNITPEQFRKIIFRNLSIQRLLNAAVYSRIQVSEDEIREYYRDHKDKFRNPESVRIRQIFIKASSEPGEERWRHARERAHTIYLNASRGSDFVRLARRHSDDPETASVGGDMGSIQKENLQDMFGTVVVNMKAGMVTKPIPSTNGFHIIKIVSISPSSTRTLEESKQYITTLIRRHRARERISQLIDELKEKARIEIIKSQ